MKDVIIAGWTIAGTSPGLFKSCAATSADERYTSHHGKFVVQMAADAVPGFSHAGGNEYSTRKV